MEKGSPQRPRPVIQEGNDRWQQEVPALPACVRACTSDPADVLVIGGVSHRRMQKTLRGHGRQQEV